MDVSFEHFLEFLRESRGLDFTGYKRSTLTRRVRKRMGELRIETFEAYADHLQADPDEFTALFNTILINVTGFWRDPEAWEVLARDYLPGILESKGGSGPIRVWSAGCASGEETYTLVMMLAEALGVDRFRERVKVYATDLDEEALVQARNAAYPPGALEAVPEELRGRYFEQTGGACVFRGDLRRLVIFGRHDLMRDAPISHLDLLVSRNTLMYFNGDTQARILNRFHFALNDGGVLFLGKAEMLRTNSSLFAPLDLRSRIFQKTARDNLRDRLMMIGNPGRADAQDRLQRQLRLRESALDANPAAQIIVDRSGVLVQASGNARALFSLGQADVGRPIQDLTVSYRPVELRSCIELVYSEGHALHLPGVEHARPDGGFRNLDVHVAPLRDGDRGWLGVVITFIDVTGYRALQAELQEANHDLETAFEELQSTNEELETTNEELQSAIEELETTNEELQSANEEMETMNEELQSTNEELETLNDELQRRSVELNHVNAHMNSILTSLRAAVVVVDHDLDVRVWNRKAEDLWGLRADEVLGHAFQNLDVGLPVERLKAAVRACADGRSQHEELILEAVNRRGRRIHCRVAITPFLGTDHEVRGSVLLIEEWPDGGATPPEEPLPGSTERPIAPA
jgi:two-component system, chemotaxis family, CheB/CheR fusion protein